MNLARDNLADNTARLLRAPYDYVGDTCSRVGSDLFEARILLRRTICMRGSGPAALFYDEDRFMRSGAMPEPVRATLLGKGGVQGLDGEAHRVRKALFLSMTGDERVGELVTLAEREWLAAIPSWSTAGQLSLYDGIQPILMRAVCAWAGVPLSAAEEMRRTRDVVALFDRAAAFGLGHLQARLARRRCEHWLSALIGDVRAGRMAPPTGGALEAIAHHRDVSGRLLAARIAAVELLNVLRPTVAVSVYIVFVAHALHSYPAAAPDRADDETAQRFVQEVRRFYPFFPALMARTRRAFRWEGIAFPKGRRVLLDLHGTNCSDSWNDADEFQPERFRAEPSDPFMFVPQGGGELPRHHRCPGEGITLALMKMALQVFTLRIAYDVPSQDLRIDRTRMPALPISRFLLRDVRIRPETVAPPAT